VHTEGVLLHTEGVIRWRLKPRYHQVSYTPRLGSPFATVVVGANVTKDMRAAVPFQVGLAWASQEDKTAL